jgi:hypothetical protein
LPRHAHRSSARRLQTIGISTLVLALVVSGCAAAADPSPTAPSRPVASTPAAVPSVPAATPSPTPGPTLATPGPTPVALTALPEGGSEVFPGRYSTHFEPALTLTIDRQVQIDCAPGYRCRGDVNVNSSNWLDLEFGHDHPIEIHIMGFQQVYDPKHPAKLIDPPKNLDAWISAFPGVTVTARKPVQVGGLDATQLDLRTGRDLAFGPTGFADFPSLGFGGHQVHRVIIVGVHGAAVIFGIGPVKPEDSTLDRLAAAAEILQPIVDSVTW